MNGERPFTRQDRRAARLLKKKQRMQKHGRSLAEMYRNAVLKRQKKRRPKV